MSDMESEKQIDEELVAFLRQIDMEFMLPTLTACNVDFRCLRYLTSYDLQAIIPKINHLAEFRAKLFKWRSECEEKEKNEKAVLKVKNEKKRTDDSEHSSDGNSDDLHKRKTTPLKLKAKREHENYFDTSNFRTPNANRKYAQKCSSVSSAASDYMSVKRDSTHFTQEFKSIKNFHMYPRYGRNDSFFNGRGNYRANRRYSKTNEFEALERTNRQYHDESDEAPNKIEHFERREDTKVLEADETAETESLSKAASDKDEANVLPNGTVLLDEELKPSQTVVDEFLNLEDVISASSRGRSIINISRRFADLTTKQRDDLISIIMDYIKYKNIKLVVRDFHFMVKQIVHVFPNEKGHSYYYFKECGLGRSPAGRLYGLYKKWATVHLNFSEVEAEPEPLKITDIKPVIIPKDETLMDFWVKSSKERFEDIMNLSIEFFLTKWPQYLEPNGYQLFQNDFEMLYNRQSNSLTRKFGNFKKNIHDLYRNTLSDHIALSIFCLLDRTITSDGENFIYILLLNAVLPATIRRIVLPDRTYKRLSFDMNDVIDCFLPLIGAPDLLEQRYEEISTKMSNKSVFELEKTPTMFAVADNYCRVHEYFLRFNTAVYKMPDVLSCIELCFQIHRVLNMPYPSIFDHFWTFIQQHFYDIHLANDSMSSGSNFIMNYLKKENTYSHSNYR